MIDLCYGHTHDRDVSVSKKGALHASLSISQRLFIVFQFSTCFSFPSQYKQDFFSSAFCLLLCWVIFLEGIGFVVSVIYLKMAGMEQAIASKVMEVTQAMEAELDREIERLDKMDDDDMEALREKRLQQLKRENDQKRDWLQKGHGEYLEISSEKEFFAECKDSPRVVVHFYRPTTVRCEIVDKHLKLLAGKHLETKFVKLNAEKAPFLTERLHVKVIPTLLTFKDSVTNDRIVGFDELGGTDDFSTEMMAWRLGKNGSINYRGPVEPPVNAGAPQKKRTTILGSKKRAIRDDDSDGDSDD